MTKAQFNKMIRECRRVYVGVSCAHDVIHVQAVKADLLYEADHFINPDQEVGFNLDADNDLYIN